MKFLSKNVEETAEIATNFVKAMLDNPNFEKNRATIVGLYGELGSGKTTFMKYLAKAFGIEETIQSPTYVIMKVYDLVKKPEDAKFSISETCSAAFENFAPSGFRRIIHIDAYRIEKEEEMLNLGWQEIISDSKNLICIEWPERIKGIMPYHTVIKFEHAGENERKIRIENNL